MVSVDVTTVVEIPLTANCRTDWLWIPIARAVQKIGIVMGVWMLTAKALPNRIAAALINAIFILRDQACPEPGGLTIQEAAAAPRKNPASARKLA